MGRCAWVLVGGLWLLGCGNDGDGGGTASRYDLGAFEAEVEAFVAEHDEVEGAGAIVVHRDHGVVYRGAFGDFAEDRQYLIASSSKVLTAGVLAGLSDDGLIDLDAPVDDYLDWGDSRPGVTVAHMLSNSSGLVGLGGASESGIYIPHVCQFQVDLTLHACGESIYRADDSADRVMPNTEFRYGGGQWQLAGAVAEIVSGKSWAELVRERYVDPCELSALAYSNVYAAASAESAEGEGIGYPSFFDGSPDDTATDNPNLEGGAYTDIDSYGALLLMHLRGGMCGETRVLSEAMVAELQVDRVEAYGDTGSAELEGYGMGWWIDRDRPGVYYDGGLFGSQPWIDTERGYGVFLVIEAGSTLGGELRMRTQSLVDAAFDEVLDQAAE